MYLCCGRNDNILGRAETEREAQRMCNTLGSSYIKIIPVLFWFMRNHNRFYTYCTTQGFLKHTKLTKMIKEKIKEKYNIKKYESFDEVEKVIEIIEEFIGDCTDMIMKRLQDPI